MTIRGIMGFSIGALIIRIRVIIRSPQNSTGKFKAPMLGTSV